MAEFHSEWTPTPFFGERLEPNVFEWVRLEQYGKGFSSRLFYNEVPKPTWIRHGGHLDNVDENVYSFTHADQDQMITFGIDTTTEEGRAKFKAEFDALHELAPEIITKDHLVYPHEAAKAVPEEAHFRRLWTYYREGVLKDQIASAVSAGSVS